MQHTHHRLLQLIDHQNPGRPWIMVPSSAFLVLTGLLMVAHLGCSSESSTQTTVDSDQEAPHDTIDDIPDWEAQPDGQHDLEVPTRQSCTNDGECSDSLDCTIDTCSEQGHCLWTLRAGSCLINNVCYSARLLNPHNPCLWCTPESSTASWSERIDGAGCDDGNACTLRTTCLSGVCQGISLECEDLEECTTNRCDPELGCLFIPVPDGRRCDDGNACTRGDICLLGECVGFPLNCDDGNPCTDNSCHPDSGCYNPNNDAFCDNGDACTVGDYCLDGECLDGPSTNCNDGNICTIDLCDPIAGCRNLPTYNPCCIGATSVCNDDNPCTDDLCDPETGDCIYIYNDANCDDGSACTTSNRCLEGECIGDPIVCDDFNDCTENLCNELVGCVFVPLTGTPCDDGVACTVDGVCQSGVCMVDDSGCRCEPDFSEVSMKLVVVRIGDGGHPGQALDLDANPETCSPRSNCSEGRDNALGVLGSLVNPPLVEAVEDGSLIMLMELQGFHLNPFTLAIYNGELAPHDGGCDVQEEVCDYHAGGDLLDRDNCQPLVALSATRIGQEILAGGPGTVFPFAIPFGDTVLTLTLYEVRFEATIISEGGAVLSLSGILGGAVKRSELLDALYAIPAELLPFPPDAVGPILELLVTDDIDTNGDGTPDAASIGILVEGIPARLVGVDW